MNKISKKRKLDYVVMSDLHLGTYGCHASEILNYLKSIDPKTLILNGDIIDIWQFKKSYFPKNHLKVIKKIIDLASKGTEVIYITGNHEKFLRRFTDFKLGNIELCNKKILNINGDKTWIFHGDVFDSSVQYSKWIAKLGGKGYDFLIRLNAISNYILTKLDKEKYSFSNKIKASIKKAVKFIGDFEKTASELALENNYDTVICGHIHQPNNILVEQKGKKVRYLNSGDWVENLTALEYKNKKWSIYTYDNSFFNTTLKVEEEEEDEKTIEQILTDVTSLL